MGRGRPLRSDDEARGPVPILDRRGRPGVADPAGRHRGAQDRGPDDRHRAAPRRRPLLGGPAGLDRAGAADSAGCGRGRVGADTTGDPAGMDDPACSARLPHHHRSGQAFAIIFVSVPIMRIAALVRRQKSADIPLIMSASAYHEVAAKICEVLNRQGLPLQAAEPGWWVSAPMRLLTWLGGEALRSHVPNRFAHFVARRLDPDALPERPGPAREPGASDLGARAGRRGRGAHRGTADDRSQGPGARAASPPAVEELRPRSAGRAKGRSGRASSSTITGSSAPWRSTGTTGRSSTGNLAAGKSRARRTAVAGRRATTAGGADLRGPDLVQALSSGSRAGRRCRHRARLSPAARSAGREPASRPIRPPGSRSSRVMCSSSRARSPLLARPAGSRS